MSNLEASRENILQESMKKKLEASGELNKIRANLRLQVLSILRKSSGAPLTDFSNHRWPHYDLINGLVSEYLHWMSFNYSKEVFSSEIGCNGISFDRCELEKKLETVSTCEMHFEDHLPLLLNILNKILNFEKL